MRTKLNAARLLLTILCLNLMVQKAFGNNVGAYAEEVFESKGGEYVEEMLLEETLIQEKQGKEKRDWGVSLGVMGAVVPAFEGAKDYGFGILPIINVSYKKFSFNNAGLLFNVKSQDGFKIDLIVSSDGGRREKTANPLIGSKTDALRGMGNVKGSFISGVYIQYMAKFFLISAKATYGIGGYNGIVSEGKIETFVPITEKSYIQIGLTIKMAGAGYNKAFFGINKEQSERSGLEVYNAKFGVVSYGLETGLTAIITPKISVLSFIVYNLMGTVPSNSPLIRERGSKHQGVIGIGGIYTF